MVLKLLYFLNIGIIWNLTDNKALDPEETRNFVQLREADALARPPAIPKEKLNRGQIISRENSQRIDKFIDDNNIEET